MMSLKTLHYRYNLFPLPFETRIQLNGPFNINLAKSKACEKHVLPSSGRIKH